MSKCLITGTFDPPTRGHEAIIERALSVFDRVAVAILVNPDKDTMFSAEQRKSMLSAVFGDRVEIVYSSGWAVDVAKELGADVLVRGIRGVQDVAYETEMARYNLDHGVDTVFFFAEEKWNKLTSTAVRDALQEGKSAEEYLSAKVLSLVTEYRGKKNG